MQISIEELWAELDINQTLEEYVKEKVDRHIARITEKTDAAIKARIIGAIKSMRKELESSKGFAECADVKINKHLIFHDQQVNQLLDLELVGEERNV